MRGASASLKHEPEAKTTGKLQPGWLNARPRLRARYHMALSLNEARELSCRFYRSHPASRFDALAIIRPVAMPYQAVRPTRLIFYIYISLSR